MPTTCLSLEDIVARTSDLPSMPAATMAVMKETDNPNGTAQSVAALLSQDQALAVRVLRLANSAFYGVPRQVEDVPDAVVVLGMRTIRRLALIASTFPWLQRPLKGYEIGPGQLWSHSMGTAVGAQVVGAKTNATRGDQAFTAGLLHDLGKVVLSVWLEGRTDSLSRIAQSEGLAFDAAERKILGYDHSDVGAHLGNLWNMPPALVASMRYHHRPDEFTGDAEPLVDAVHVGNYLAKLHGATAGAEGVEAEVSEIAMKRLQLRPEDLERLADDFSVSFEKQRRLIEGIEE
jgi:HD-like signal output (HDOD) protein